MFFFFFLDKHAEEAILSRLSHAAYMRAEEARLKVASKLSVKQIAKLAAIFCVVVSILDNLLHEYFFLPSLFKFRDKL